MGRRVMLTRVVVVGAAIVTVAAIALVINLHVTIAGGKARRSCSTSGGRCPHSPEDLPRRVHAGCS